MVWCRGTVGDQIFAPWLAKIEALGGTFLPNTRVTDLVLDAASGEVTGVVCGEERLDAEAVVFAVGVGGMQKIVAGRWGRVGGGGGGVGEGLVGFGGWLLGVFSPWRDVPLFGLRPSLPVAAPFHAERMREELPTSFVGKRDGDDEGWERT